MKKTQKKPDHPALTDNIWNAANYLSQKFTIFQNLQNDVLTKIRITLGNYDHTININVQNKTESKRNWNNLLSNFEKLVLFKALREEKVRRFRRFD